MSSQKSDTPYATPTAGPNRDPSGRRRGRRPGDAAERRARVEQALRELESARVPFTMGDVAERAGISRATLYRDAGLRDLVGSRGDSPGARPVDWRAHQSLQTRAETLAGELRATKRALRKTEKDLRETQEAAYQAEKRAREDARRARTNGLSGADADRVAKQAYAEGFAAGARVVGGGRRTTAGGAPGGANTRPEANLAAAAARLPPAKLLAARRQLARALHPDLFVKDPAAALLATELLKQINGLANDAAARGGDKP